MKPWRHLSLMLCSLPIAKLTEDGEMKPECAYFIGGGVNQ